MMVATPNVACVRCTNEVFRFLLSSCTGYFPCKKQGGMPQRQNHTPTTTLAAKYTVVSQGHTASVVPPWRVCTLCEWPLREILNENASMGVQNNYFVRKRPFLVGWNGEYGFKKFKKIKYRSLRENTTPIPHTGWPWWPFNALFVLCRSLVSAATLGNANSGQIRANFARIRPNFRVRACTSSP